jgi:hypothetical protein
MKSSIIGIILLAAISCSYAQSNPAIYGPRRIVLYDNIVTLPNPPAVKDSVYTYWKYYQTTAGVRSVLDSLDTVSAALSLLCDANFTKAGDTVTSTFSYGTMLIVQPPKDTIRENFDYIVYGTVSNAAAPVLILKLETAGSRELVKSDTVSLVNGFDPAAAGKLAAKGFGSIYDTIIAFEKKVRAQSGLYAIAPKVTLTAEKTVVKKGEVVPVTVKAMDCDSVALGNWTITFQASGGTVTPSTVTTDAQGIATALFNAGDMSIPAVVTAVKQYLQPAGKVSLASVMYIYFDIDKPADAWVGRADYQYESKSTMTRSTQYETASSNLETKIDIFFVGLVYDISPVATAFTSDPNKYVIRKSAHKSEKSDARRHWQNEAGYIDEKSYHSTFATDVKDSLPAPTIRVSDNGFTVGLKDIPATQTGDGHSTDKSYSKTQPPEESSVPYVADPDIKLGFSITGKPIDTSYILTERTEAGGLVTVSTTNIRQTCDTKDGGLWLSYYRDFEEKTEFSMGFSEVTTKTEHTYLFGTLLPFETRVNHRYEGLGKRYNLLIPVYNPLSGVLLVRYNTAGMAQAEFSLFSLSGDCIANFSNVNAGSGSHSVQWDAKRLSPGIYLLKMNINGRSDAVKFLIRK